MVVNTYELVKNNWDYHILKNGAPFLISIGNQKLAKRHALTICVALRKLDQAMRMSTKRSSRTRIINRGSDHNRRKSESVNK